MGTSIMSEKSQREAYIRASDQRVAKWSKSKREAFQSAVDRIIEPQQRSTSASSMNQNKGGEVTPELLIQQWVDKLEGLGFTDFQ